MFNGDMKPIVYGFFRIIPSQFPRNNTKLKTLAKDFVGHKLSAAGVSYIVNERNRLRRYLWLILVTGCIIFMGYLTSNVVSEYMKYPKMMIKEDVIEPRLAFPAVTVCSLNPIAERFAKETSLKRHIELRKLLDAARQLPYRVEWKEECVEQPLCKWSWFQESCECVNNPCHTEHCLPYNDTYCSCSSAICRSASLACIQTTISENVCMCDTADTYEHTVEQRQKVDIEDILAKIHDNDVQDIIKLVWNSSSYDLSDVEEGLMPTMEEIYQYGITFDNLVASCSFETEHCHRNNFTVLYHPKYGKCYMFNYVGDQSQIPPINTNNYGSNSGLRLVLRVTDREVLDLVRREVGARIVIHDPRQLPFVAEYGVNLRPLDMTAVEVSMSTMTRLPKPWGDCVPEHTINNNEPYSILGCEKKCNLNYLTRKCKCAMRHLLHGSVLLKKTTDFPLCNLSNIEQRDCVDRVTDELEKRMTDCQCKPPCIETIYSYSVTSSELNRNYFKTVKAIRTLAAAADGNLTYIKSADQKSMIGVKVYYNTFQVSKQSEKESYSWETLIANIGGNLGFFMGLTLITFLEIVEFLWDVLITTCRPMEENKVYVVPNISRVFSRTGQQKTKIILPRRKSV